MARSVSRGLGLAIALGSSLTLAGCYIPGGGWTLRGGADLRTHRKPAAFVELVDTRWDEYNRLAEMNYCQTLGNTVQPAGASGYTPAPAGPMLAPGAPVEPARPVLPKWNPGQEIPQTLPYGPANGSGGLSPDGLAPDSLSPGEQAPPERVVPPPMDTPLGDPGPEGPPEPREPQQAPGVTTEAAYAHPAGRQSGPSLLPPSTGAPVVPAGGPTYSTASHPHVDLLPSPGEQGVTPSGSIRANTGATAAEEPRSSAPPRARVRRDPTRTRRGAQMFGRPKI